MELTQMPLPLEGAEQLNSVINEHVKPFVVAGITAGIQRTQMERELAEETFTNIMSALNLDVPNPFSMRHYDVTVSLGYDTIFTLTNYEFDGDEEELEEHIIQELDITVEAKYEISFGGSWGTYEDDGGTISNHPEDGIREALSIEITERD